MRSKPKQNSLYNYGNRQENIIHARLRMGCSILKDHLHKMHNIDSGICYCEKASETIHHYFLSCPLFKQQRLKLQSDLQNKLQLCLNAVIVDDLLYGRADLSDKLNKILFEIVHCYIADTKPRISIVLIKLRISIYIKT